MATGDRINGKQRYRIQRGDGSLETVLKPHNVREFDPGGNLTEAMYLNMTAPIVQRHYQPPVEGGRFPMAPEAIVLGGETLKVEHKANATVTNDIDVSADQVELAGVLIDTNYPKGHKSREQPLTLTTQDNALSTDVAESASSYVSWFEYSPAQNEIFLPGHFQKAVPVEN